MVNKFWSFIISREFAVILVFFLLTFVVISLLLPDVRLIFTPSFLILSATLILTTILCTAKRLLRLLFKDSAASEYGGDLKYSKYVGKFLKRAEIEETLGSILGTKWRIKSLDNGKSTLYHVLERNIFFGNLASIFFHLSMIMVVASLLVTNYYNFSGTMLLTEGQTLPLRKSSLISVEKGSSLGFLNDGSFIALKQVVPVLYRGLERKDFSSRINLTKKDGQSSDFITKVNEPLSYEGYDFILRRYGFAPRFIVEKRGKEMMDSYVNLDVINHWDFFTVPSSRLKIKILLYPDFKMIQGKPRSITLLPKKPVFALAVFNDGKKIFTGLMRKGQTIKAENYQIRFSDLSYWIMLSVVREYGISFVYVSTLILIISILARFLMPERKIALKMSSKKKGVLLEMGGTSNYFPALFDEKLKSYWEKLIAELEA